MSSHVPLPKDKHNKSKLFVTLSSLDSKKPDHRKCIDTHSFNYRSTFIANTRDLKSLVTKYAGCYYRITLKPTDLIDPAFIDNYIKRNDLVALSIGDRIDTGDVFAIDGQGTLILSLCKDTYERLGLVGQPAQFPLERGARYIVKIDLKAEIMKPEKKHYQRTKQRFESVLDQDTEFLMGRFDSQTGMSLVLDLPGARVCEPLVQEHDLGAVWVPDTQDLFSTVSVGGKPSDVWVERAQEIFEWVGLAASTNTEHTRLLSNTEECSDTCMYMVDEPRSLQNLKAVSISGLVSAKAIWTIAQELLLLLSKEPQNMQETSKDLVLCVWGHEDAPISWASSEHGYLTSGENMYAQIYNKDSNQCTTFQACGPWDSFS